MESVVDKIQGKDKPVNVIQLSSGVVLNRTYTLVIDAGHGGADRGALGVDGISKESDLTLQLAKACQDANTNPNIKIVLTRKEDQLQTLVEKANIANNLNADLFISLHCNEARPVLKEGKKVENPTNGIEIFIANKEKAYNYSANEMFAQQVGNVLKNNAYQFVGIKSRKQGVWVIQAVKCPSMLIEAGYMTDQSDLNNMKDPAYQTKLANSILQGVQQYLSSVESTKSSKDTTILVNGKAMPSVEIQLENLPAQAIEKVTIAGKDSLQPLFILDGKILPKANFNTIHPNSIESIDVLKGQAAKALYGDAGKNGVILIKSKQVVISSHNIDGKYKVTIEPTGVTSAKKIIDPNVKYYLDGILSDSASFHKIDPQQIARVDILKGEQAIAKYGADAGVGVVQITTKANATDSTYVNTKGIVLKQTPTAGGEDYDKVFTVTQIPAEFPGGTVAWEKYLQRNLKTDFLKQQNAPQGKYTVSVEFIVDKTGNVNSVHALNDPGYGTKEAAENLIKKGPMWRAAIQNGKTVVYKAKREISFVM